MRDPQHDPPAPNPEPEPTPPRRGLGARLRRYWWTAIPAVLLLAALLALGYVNHSLYRPVRLTEPATVRVRERESFARVAAGLEHEGLIPSARILGLYARRSGVADKIKPGVYRVETGTRPVDIVAMLVEGTQPVAFFATIPEGKWVAEYPDYLRERWPQAAVAFPTEVADVTAWRTKAPVAVQGTTLEGYLFPDTYEFAVDATAEQMVERMLKTFDDRIGTAYRTERRPDDARSLHEVLILASLVEAEAKVDDERGRIAGVLVNRLTRHMPLQVDATVIYAHKKRLKRVLYKDLEIDSPYNTYHRKVPGLPVGPICNPGLKSFQAALNPVATDELYYVARRDGSHIFSRTLREHNAAIRQAQGR